MSSTETPTTPTPSNPELDTQVIDEFVPLPPPDQPEASPYLKTEGVFGLYAFFPASDAELLAIARACHAGLVADGAWGGPNGPTQNVLRPAPKPLWLGEEEEATVERVVAYHRDVILRSPGWGGAFFDRGHMVIAKTPDWRTEGVTMVTVEAMWLQDIGDAGEAYKRGWDEWTFRPGAVGHVIANLQIGNMGWTEFTEMDSMQPEGKEPDQRNGKRMIEMLDEGEEDEKRWAEELAKEYEERDKLVSQY